MANGHESIIQFRRPQCSVDDESKAGTGFQWRTFMQNDFHDIVKSC